MNILVTAEDVLEIHALIESLSETRKLKKLTKSAVANKMRVHGHDLSALEKDNVDPKLSFLQGYARALGGRIEIKFIPTYNLVYPPDESLPHFPKEDFDI